MNNNIKEIGSDAFWYSKFYNKKKNWSKKGQLYIGNYLIEANKYTTKIVKKIKTKDGIVKKYENSITVKKGTKLIGSDSIRCYNESEDEINLVLNLPASVKYIGSNAVYDEYVDNLIVNYAGSKKQWKKVKKDKNNIKLNSAKINFNSKF